MASRGLGYDYGTGGSGAGGKIRRRPASRSVAASPYARPAPAPAPATATASASVSQGRGWFSRLISAGASRFLPSLFRKPSPQLAAPLPSPRKSPLEPLLLRQDVGLAFVPTQPELSNAPPSPPPPPLEDDFPEGEENGGAVANILGTENSSKVRDGNMLRNSDEHSLLNLEDLLKQKTFKRIPKSVLEEGSIAQKCDKMNADDLLMSSKSSGQVTSFTCNPVFKVANSKLSTLSIGLQHASNSLISDIHPVGGLISRASSSSAGSSDTASTNSASVSAQRISTGGAISSSRAGSLSAVAGATVQSFLTPSLASSGAGSDGAPFSFSSQFGTASSSVTQGKSKTVISSTLFSFSQQFGTVSSFSTQNISKSASTEPTIFSGNQHTQPGNNNTVFTHKPSEKPSGLNSQSVASSAVVSASLGSPFSASSLFSSAGSSSTLVTVAVPPFSPMSSSATGSGSAFSASSVFGSRLTTTGLPNFGSASSPLSLTPSAVFSFTSATPSIPNSSPTTSIFTSATGSTTGIGGIGQMNGGNRSTDRKDSPFSTTFPFGIPSNSPSTPIFSSPATQFASTTSASPEVFKFGEQNASSGGFSLGTGGGNEKPGRKFIRVKRRK